MTTATPDSIEQRLAAHVSDRVSCGVVSDYDGRIGCVTPLQYANGDSVVVWVRPLVDDRFEVADYGDALAESATKGPDRRLIEQFADELARGHGMAFAKGRFVVQCGLDDLAEYVWRLAMAAGQAAQAGKRA